MSVFLVLHDLTRWLVVLFGLLAVILAVAGRMSRSPFKKRADIVGLLFQIVMDIQVFFGFLLYFNDGWFDKLKHIGVYMKDPNQRFFTAEHWLIMLIAWVMVHAGRSAVKRATTDDLKYRKMLVYFGIAMLLILIGIPWPFREDIARPWVRWF